MNLIEDLRRLGALYNANKAHLKAMQKELRNAHVEAEKQRDRYEKLANDCLSDKNTIISLNGVIQVYREQVRTLQGRRWHDGVRGEQ